MEMEHGDACCRRERRGTEKALEKLTFAVRGRTKDKGKANGWKETESVGMQETRRDK